MAGLLAFLLAGVVGVGAYAFTAGNTQEAKSGAGANVAVVSGYKTSNLHFTLLGGTATTAEFTAEAIAGEADAKEAEINVVKTAGEKAWTHCVLTTPGTTAKFTCTFEKPLTNTEIEEDLVQETVVTS
jgi:RNA 3'-terminal phosphate cyclase